MTTRARFERHGNRLLIAALVAAYPGIALADVAGRFQFVSGDVRVVAADGRERPAQKGQEVSEGETVLTAADGSAQLKMIDGALLAVRPASQLKMVTYTFKGKEDGSEKAAFSLVKGGLRAISGLIGKTNKENYSLTTPTATIGIRGTDHEPTVILPPPPGTQAANPPGTYDKVNVGATSLTTEAGTTVIARNQVGFAAAANQPPMILPTMPNFYQSSPTPPARPEQRPASDKPANSSGESMRTDTRSDAAQLPDTAFAAAATTTARANTDGAASVAAATALPQANTLTAIDGSGNTLDTLAQTVTTPTGSTVPLIAGVPLPVVVPPVVTVPVRPVGPQVEVLAGYSGVPVPDSTVLGALNGQIVTLQGELAAAQTRIASATSLAGAALTSIKSAQTSADSLSAAYENARLAGVSGTDTVLMQVANALSNSQLAVSTSRLAYDGNGSDMPSGTLAALGLLDQAVRSGNQLVTVSRSTYGNLGEGARRDLELGLQSARYSGSQVMFNASMTTGNADSALSSAQFSADQAATAAANASAALMQMSLGDTNRSVLQAAVDAAVSAATAAAAALDATRSALVATVAALPIGNALAVSVNGLYAFQPYPMPNFFRAGGAPSIVTRDAAGNLVSASSEAYFGSGFRSVLSQTGSTLLDLGSDAATGLSWGRWQGGEVTQTGQYDSVSQPMMSRQALGAGSLHWITGTNSSPDYLAQVLTGTAQYKLVGGTQPTDSLGNIGALTNASLGVNFSTQRVNAGVNFSLAESAWGLQGTDMPLYGREFYSYSCSPESNCTGNLVVTKNGSSLASGYGQLSGLLTGTGLNGATLQYGLQEPVLESRLDPITGQTFEIYVANSIQGVAGFSGPTQNAATPYRAVGITDEFESFDGLPTTVASGGFKGGDAPVGRVVDSPAGLTEFVGYAYYGSGTSSYFDTPATIKIGTAVNRDVGSTDIGGLTVSWGRWEGGAVDIFSRDGATRLTSLDNAGKSVHWLTSSALTGPLANLPLTGTATYGIAGFTNPTDLRGNVGQLGAATLNADFANLKVNAAISVNFNAPTNTSNLSMTASNIPLYADGSFQSGTGLAGVLGSATGTHTASCAGSSCGPQTSAALQGGLIGNGAPGAVMTYRFSTGAAAGTTELVAPPNVVTGLVVMKR